MPNTMPEVSRKSSTSLVEFSMRLSGVISMQKHNHGQRLRISAIGVADDKVNHLAERSFLHLVGRVCTSLKWNRFECFCQYPDGSVTVFGGRQIELGLTVVAPVSYSDGVGILQMIKCGRKSDSFRRKFCRGSKRGSPPSLQIATSQRVMGRVSYRAPASNVVIRASCWLSNTRKSSLLRSRTGSPLLRS